MKIQFRNEKMRTRQISDDNFVKYQATWSPRQDEINLGSVRIFIRLDLEKRTLQTSYMFVLQC